MNEVKNERNELSRSDMLDAAIKAEGLARRDKSLGIQSMPEGYALILNGDQTHYYWYRYDSTEGYIDWDKWRVRRAAIAHSKIQSNTEIGQSEKQPTK